MKTGKSIVVKGRVQGVFYRASTMAEAQKLGLTGWVKNLSNGDVYIEVYGEIENLDLLITWCKKGPQYARVDEVIDSDIPYQEMVNFQVKYD